MNRVTYLILINLILLGIVLTFSTCSRADVVELITKEAHRQHFDPAIAIAVATVESGLNQNAIGKAGEIGIYQILPRNAGNENLFDLKTNIRVGIEHLKYWKRNCPTIKGIEFVNCYNSGFRRPKHPMLRPYVKKVAAVMEARND